MKTALTLAAWVALVRATASDVSAAVVVLMVLMGLDVLTGVLAAGKERRASSEAAHRGMVKKGATLLLIVAAVVVEPFLPGVPLAMLGAGGFMLVELLSLVENAGRLGVSVGFLRLALAKLQPPNGSPVSRKEGTGRG